MRWAKDTKCPWGFLTCSRGHHRRPGVPGSAAVAAGARFGRPTVVTAGDGSLRYPGLLRSLVVPDDVTGANTPGVYEDTGGPAPATGGPGPPREEAISTPVGGRSTPHRGGRPSTGHTRSLVPKRTTAPPGQQAVNLTCGPAPSWPRPLSHGASADAYLITVAKMRTLP